MLPFCVLGLEQFQTPIRLNQMVVNHTVSTWRPRVLMGTAPHETFVTFQMIAAEIPRSLDHFHPS
jgi:hypothetical protein